jgi:hypothetical protein
MAVPPQCILRAEMAEGVSAQRIKYMSYINYLINRRSYTHEFVHRRVVDSKNRPPIRQFAHGNALASAARERTSFGTRGSQVQILPLRPLLSQNRSKSRQWVRQHIDGRSENATKVLSFVGVRVSPDCQIATKRYEGIVVSAAKIANEVRLWAASHGLMPREQLGADANIQLGARRTPTWSIPHQNGRQCHSALQSVMLASTKQLRR